MTKQMYRILAMMDDNKFEKWSAAIGFTVKPEPDGETMYNFRCRVIDSLERPLT